MRLLTCVGQSPDAAAEAVLLAATSNLADGVYFGPGSWLQTRGAPRAVRPHRRATDQVMARRLVALSEELTSVRLC